MFLLSLGNSRSRYINQVRYIMKNNTLEAAINELVEIVENENEVFVECDKILGNITAKRSSYEAYSDHLSGTNTNHKKY